jgi:hypothetical protein
MGNRLTDGEQYGFLTAGSNNTLVAGNTVASATALRFIDICMDDVAGTQFSNNHNSGYRFAICVSNPGRKRTTQRCPRQLHRRLR